jgi:hypothetical protein
MMVLISAAAVCVAVASSGETDVEMLRAVRTAYTANRNALAHGVIRFRFIVTDTTQRPDRRERGAAAGYYSGKGLYVYDGSNARYECLFPPEEEVAARTQVGDRSFSTPLNSFRALTDGKLTLWDQVGVAPGGKTAVHSAQIDPGTQQFYQYFNFTPFPLQLGNPRPQPLTQLDRAIDNALNPATGWKVSSVDDRATIGETTVLHLAFSVPRPMPDVSFWVDLERGAVPRQIRLADEVAGETVKQYSDLRSVAGKAWLPFRQTGERGKTVTTELVIDEADFDAVPSRSLFRLEFPEPPRPMVNSATGQRYAPQKVWDLSRLPSASTPIGVDMSRLPPAAPTMPGPREPKAWWPALAVVVGVVLFAATVGVWLRLRKRGSHA